MARNYSDETKAAVMAALLAGQSVSSLAKEYKIPKGTISSWKFKAQGFATQKREIGEQVEAYLSANLESLRKQAIFFGEPSWLVLQSAGEVAVLHGVMTDKAIRIIEALNASAEPEN